MYSRFSLLNEIFEKCRKCSGIHSLFLLWFHSGLFRPFLIDLLIKIWNIPILPLRFLSLYFTLLFNAEVSLPFHPYMANGHDRNCRQSIVESRFVWELRAWTVTCSHISAWFGLVEIKFLENRSKAKPSWFLRWLPYYMETNWIKLFRYWLLPEITAYLGLHLNMN